MVNCGVVVVWCIGGGVRRLYGSVCGGIMVLVMFGILVSSSGGGVEWCYGVCVVLCKKNFAQKALST